MAARAPARGIFEEYSTGEDHGYPRITKDDTARLSRARRVHGLSEGLRPALPLLPQLRAGVRRGGRGHERYCVFRFSRRAPGAPRRRRHHGRRALPLQRAARFCAADPRARLRREARHERAAPGHALFAPSRGARRLRGDGHQEQPGEIRRDLRAGNAGSCACAGEYIAPYGERD